MRMRRAAVAVAAVTALVTGGVVTTTTAQAATHPRTLHFGYVQYNAPGTDTSSNVNGEYVELHNYTSSPIYLKDYYVYDYGTGRKCYLPNYRLVAGATVAVHTGAGTHTAGHIYCGYGSHMWNNTGDTAYLYYWPSSPDVLKKKCSWGNGSGRIDCHYQ